ncbi:MAG: hypothetical protein H7249_05215 [Chitinophagaceae bacterium]|nr:hypothetical protein [Oligoflexus sp.]
MLVKKLFVASCLFLLSGCLSTIDSTHLQTPTPVPDDAAYTKIYDESSQKFDFIDKFVTKYKVHITQLNTTFRQALANRYEKVFFEPQPLLAEASQKTAYFVTIYSSDRHLEDMADQRIWSVQLRTGTSVLKPSAITRVQPKERWQVFFPDINIWSSEYLLLFDQAPAANQPDALNAVSELILASPTGSITTRW